MMRVIKLALFGLETRYVGKLYLQRALIALFALSAMVMAIDISVNFDTVTSTSGARGLDEPTLRIAFYLLLRFSYNLPAIIPLSCAIGIVWSELTLARGFERAMIINTGRSGLMSLAPAALVGVTLGLLQVFSMAVLRPMSVEAHAQHGFRTSYGPRLGQMGPTEHWITLPDAVLHARIDFRVDPPDLRDITIYKLGQEKRLRAIIMAPASGFEGQVLTLTDASLWALDAENSAQVRTRFLLNPVWLRNTGLEPRFWTHADLISVTRQTAGVSRPEIYRAILQSRYAGFIRLVAISVLMATLCFAMMRLRPGLSVAIKLAAAGYGLQFLTQYLTTLGKHGHLAPVPAFWGLPGLVILLVVAHHMRQGFVVRRATLRPAGTIIGKDRRRLSRRV